VAPDCIQLHRIATFEPEDRTVASVYRLTPAGTSNGPQTEPPRLLDCLRFALRAKHYAYRTEQAYVHWVRRFILHHGKRHPQEMGGPESGAHWTPWRGRTPPFGIWAVRCG